MLKVIETAYNGFRFRSRQEARWAVLLDTLGIPYRYELEGFDLGNGVRYLPDFWLPDQEVWLEIKGAQPTKEEFVKATKLAQNGDCPVAIFWNRFNLASFFEDNLVFFKDGMNVFHTAQGIGSMTLGVDTWDWGSLMIALEEARGARFEFGENGNGHKAA